MISVQPKKKGGGHISFPQAVRKDRPDEKENSETRWAFFLVAKLTLSNIWRSLMSVSSSSQFCSLTNQQLSLLYHSSDLISDKETILIILIIRELCLDGHTAEAGLQQQLRIEGVVQR